MKMKVMDQEYKFYLVLQKFKTINNFERASNLCNENIMVIKTEYTKKFFINVICPWKL